jgi:beta-galactosidase
MVQDAARFFIADLWPLEFSAKERLRLTSALKLVVRAALLCCVVVGANHRAPAQGVRMSPVTIDGDHFVRDGKPYQIISGTIHYPRVPREYWRDRLKKARAMGLNTVETYVFWNLHEPQLGKFDFTGQLDVAAFIRTAQEEGLNVIVRPGPYVCAEWEAGGFPAWLFADPALQVRTRDPKFLEAADRYLMRVGEELGGLQVSRGGPIIAVQVENEYGSFGHDKEYMEHIHQSLIKAGLGEGLFYTSDGADQLPNDALPGVLAVINFGPGEAQRDFAKLAKLRPGQPRMTGEYWDGWFDSWGNKQHAHTNAEQQAKEVAWILSLGNSINLYMFHGGTTFGFMNGANFGMGPNGHYYPQTTSYDYDAALDEAGRPTKKFFLLRDVIEKHTGIAPPPLPPDLPIATVPAFALSESASLWDNLPAPVNADTPKPMETFGQAYGYILYRAQITGPVKGELSLGEVRSFATVYVDQTLAGTADRMKKQTSVAVDVPAGPHTLDVVVENTGRVNFGPHLTDGRAGLVDPVTLDGRAITGWKVYSLPMKSPEFVKRWKSRAQATARGPWFHRGTFPLETAADTYLDTSALAKGFVWVNGHNLGRTWDIGPQKSLFVPAPWLRAGKNEVVVFDYAELPPPITLRGATEPVWSQPGK